jgi:hypothetical protein
MQEVRQPGNTGTWGRALSLNSRNAPNSPNLLGNLLGKFPKIKRPKHPKHRTQHPNSAEFPHSKCSTAPHYTNTSHYIPSTQ